MTALLRGVSLRSLLILLLVTSACDASDSDSDDDVGVDGASSVTLSGGFSKSTPGGRAAFATGADYDDLDGPGVAFVLYESSAADVTWLLLYSEGSNTLPAPGTYPIVDATTETPAPGTYGALYVTSSGGRSIVAVPTSGTLTVRRSASDRIDGSIAFTGSGYAMDDAPSVTDVRARLANTDAPTSVSLTGSFQARRADRSKIDRLIDELGFDRPILQGSSSFKVSGSATRLYDGFATFGSTATVPVASDEAFAIVLYTEPSSASEDDGAGLLLVRVGTGERPTPGTYDVADLSGDAAPAPGEFLAFLIDSETNLFAVGVTGAVTIQTSSDARITGLVAFGAVDGTGQDASAQYTVTGSYEAVSGDVGDWTLPTDASLRSSASMPIR